MIIPLAVFYSQDPQFDQSVISFRRDRREKITGYDKEIESPTQRLSFQTFLTNF